MTLGVRLLLVSVGVLFLATIAAFLVVRFSPAAGSWHGLRPPLALAISTLALVASTVAFEGAVRRIRRGDRVGLARWLRFAFALGLAFLAAQAWCWIVLLRGLSVDAARAESATVLLAAWMFVVLTALHALHVIGGLVPLALVVGRATQGRYTASQHVGVLHVRTYWHFLGAAWLAVLATIMLAA